MTIVAWRLQIANAALCPDVVALPGFSVETPQQYAASERPEAAAELGLSEQPQVSAIVPESSAAKAGLKVGDTILPINCVPAPKGGTIKGPYGQTRAVEAALATALTHPSVSLALRSGTVPFSGARLCVGGAVGAGRAPRCDRRWAAVFMSAMRR